MSHGHLDDLGLPESLIALLRAVYGDTESARRAALAPWPELGFRSAQQESTLFRERSAVSVPRGQKIELLLRTEPSRFGLDRPYFVAAGTTGTIRSPYPELTDAEFWTFVDLWGSEEDARRELNAPYQVLGGLSGLQYVQRARRPGIRSFMSRLLSGPGHGSAALAEVYTWHLRNQAGVYA